MGVSQQPAAWCSSAVLDRFLLAAQDAQGARGEGFHLEFAREPEDRPQEGHALPDPSAEEVRVGQAAREDDPVHAAREDRRHGADLLGHLVGHGLVDLAGFGVAGLDAALHLAGVVRARGGP